MHKDYLGTILAITDEKGKLVEERHFDAWGNLTHGSMQVLDRGYTIHEHLQEVGLIHMNGRLYDPMLRRFLNADEHIQDPTNTQCYNKYGYVMNNPLMFSDPDGEYAVGVAIAVAALVAVLSYTVTIYARDGSLRHWKLGDAYVSAIYGAFSGTVTFGVGSIFSAAGGTTTALAESIKGVAGGAGLAVVQAGAHAVTQGVLSSVQGGNFWSAALSGAFGSLGASAFGAIGGDFAKSTVGTITFGAISGGVGAELSGGNFWQGVVIGGIVVGLNHAMHNALDEGPEGEGPKPKKYSVRKGTVEPSLAKAVEVEGNALGVTDLLRSSKLGKFVRNGRPVVGGISSGIKVAVRTLGVVGIGLEAAEVYKGNIYFAEFGVDTGMALIGMTGWGTPVALVYFGGKAIYEYSSGKTLFPKPIK
ncbi:hypothetical protein BWK59_12960 [Flavobacterium davisii]|uniref:Teneurin-like YD-shell domain-containing protein n=1 Tax=Flavobacterium davisii TaxID=2906077 RepID=A0A246GFS1_9FLAO|nr:RHS repeat-associated core domain-containing protein [Flavobacterium davisii]OWP82982.1 hypothetical protein BWK59_12960 [Flavobacterium davisii]